MTFKSIQNLAALISLSGLLAVSTPITSAETIGSDDFDTSVEGTDYVSRTITNGVNNAANTFAVVNRENLVFPGMIDTSVSAGGVVALNEADDLGFLSEAKSDSFFGMYRNGANGVLTYVFDITGFNNLQLSLDWVMSGGVTTNRLASVSYTIDDGSPATIFQAGLANLDNFFEPFDRGGDSVRRSASWGTTVNGLPAGNLTDEFQTFVPSISGTGSTLTITIVLESTVGGTFGGYGIDNLVLSGDRITGPPGDGGLQLIISRSGGGLDFSWGSAEGMGYDLLSSPDLSTSPETWEVYDDGVTVYGNIPASGTGTNTLVGVLGLDPVRFFALREKPL
ncbi:hypothetical protein [Haloferula sp.]|uniref:hypothetical protein n=1 Tax=Haloferula sp. TaxID=2497595 RepID=UPI003C716303